MGANGTNQKRCTIYSDGVYHVSFPTLFWYSVQNKDSNCILYVRYKLPRWVLFRLALKLMVISFLQRRCHPVTKCIKKLLNSPVIMYFFIWEGQNTNIKKGYSCVDHLLRSIARSLLFRLQILSACFYIKKTIFFKIVLLLNANFLYYWPCSFNNVMFP